MRRTAAITAAAFILLFGSAVTLRAQEGDERADKHAGEARGGKDEHARDRREPAPGQPQRVSQQEQEQRIQQERQRTEQYRARLDEQLSLAQQQNAQLQQQQRMAQYRAQQQYQANLREQQEALRNERAYGSDPYFYTPANYRYDLDGVVHQTNQYGADQLGQAVRYGYQEGYRSGQADRRDRFPSDYSNAYAYQDANYGYNGRYVEQSDYNAYFREGFRRGYDDGYYSRSRYGNETSNGGASILSRILGQILGLTAVN